uniref:Uncharacterized protein n=1 Tax=Avena sativa TaxID=4498 RepID=A0ACD6A0J5_AVESA
MATTASNRRIDSDEPSGTGSGDCADFISNLPDEVLGTVVSLLPTREGGRTQALSRRCRRIWRVAPLNLDDRDGRGFSEKVVTRILSGHIGSARRIALTRICPLPSRYDYSKHREIYDDAGDGRIDEWLRSRDLSLLQELELAYSYEGRGTTLPPSLFRLAPALRVARFGCCRLPPNLAVDFPHLQQLTLHRVTLTDETFRAVLSGCPTLESLLLEKNVGVGCFRVSSPTLRSIGFVSPCKQQGDDTDDVHELVVEDAPCLDRLLSLSQKYGSAIIRVIWAPKLEILGLLSYGISQLHIGTTVFQKMIAVSLTTTMPTLKVLALDYVGPDLDAVHNFLKCFPCLESLYIILDPRRFEHTYCENKLPLLKKMENMPKYASLDDPTECLELHLKKVALKVYYGRGVEVDFARFFVLNAKVLQKMEFGLVDDFGDEWRAIQNMKLQLEDRASHDAQLEFKRFSWNTFKENKKHTHDLSIANPFGASFFDGYVSL